MDTDRVAAGSFGRAPGGGGRIRCPGAHLLTISSRQRFFGINRHYMQKRDTRQVLLHKDGSTLHSVRSVSTPPGPPLSPETGVPAPMLATAQLLRRLRAQAGPDKLDVSQTAVLARLEEHGGMTTADLARVAAMKP
jgi:hypothetical protein